MLRRPGHRIRTMPVWCTGANPRAIAPAGESTDGSAPPSPPRVVRDRARSPCSSRTRATGSRLFSRQWFSPSEVASLRGVAGRSRRNRPWAVCWHGAGGPATIIRWDYMGGAAEVRPTSVNMPVSGRVSFASRSVCLPLTDKAIFRPTAKTYMTKHVKHEKKTKRDIAR